MAKTTVPDPRYVVQAAGVAVVLQQRAVLQHVQLQIAKGEFVYLIGRTGAGKSTLLRLLYADLPLHKGKLRVGKYDVANIRAAEIPYLRRSLGVVFQDFQLLPDRSVYDNIAYLMRATGWTDRQAVKKRITEVLMRVGLSHRANALPHQLSGGEQQRTVIARALVNDPVLLIADEPTGNLDPEVTDHIMDILHKINRGGTAVLMATHEHDLIRRYPARVLECRDGTVREATEWGGTASYAPNALPNIGGLPPVPGL